MLRLSLALLLVLPAMAAGAAPSACAWPAWEQFKKQLIEDTGRVVDPSSDRRITTSEGQSYALFFALVANDRILFRRLLRWTEDNLARGDLTARLPAWLWGRTDQNKWEVLDTNSASDSDLWIAYTLLEAGRLWDEHAYASTGALLLRRIAQEEVADLPGLGPMMLPGKTGFTGEGTWRLNPSYLPLPVLRRLSATPGPWAEMAPAVQRMLMETSPKGFAPDWTSWHRSSGWQPDPQHGSEGDYDAIRVYLWTGMLSDEDPAKPGLLRHFAPMTQLTTRNGLPPETVDALTGQASGSGPVGFSSALLPFLAGTPAAQVQRERVQAHSPAAQAYYDQVLTLFGQGWDEQRFRFDTEGRLQPAWATCKD